MAKVELTLSANKMPCYRKEDRTMPL